MARSIATIQATIVAAKNAQASLNNLNSPSQTAIWNLWTYIVATAQWFHETLWDDFQATITAQIAAAKWGTAQWWIAQLYAFQYGYLLQIINYKPGYAIIDPTAQIVTRASMQVSNTRVLQMKVATGSTPQALTLAQQNALNAYVNQIKPPGTYTQIISLPGDLLQLNWTIYYNALEDVPTIQAAVYAAINNYLNTLNSAANFNGYFDINQCVLAILNVPGVDDVTATNTQASPADGSYSTFTRNYQALSGWFVIDPAFPLSATLNFVAG